MDFRWLVFLVLWTVLSGPMLTRPMLTQPQGTPTTASAKLPSDHR